MGSLTSRQVLFYFQDGAYTELKDKRIRINKSIQKMQGNTEFYSRVGILVTNKDDISTWFWIHDRSLSLEHYIQVCNIQKDYQIHLYFIK